MISRVRGSHWVYDLRSARNGSSKNPSPQLWIWYADAEPSEPYKYQLQLFWPSYICEKMVSLRSTMWYVQYQLLTISASNVGFSACFAYVGASPFLALRAYRFSSLDHEAISCLWNALISHLYPDIMRFCLSHSAGRPRPWIRYQVKNFARYRWWRWINRGLSAIWR